MKGDYTDKAICMRRMLLVKYNKKTAHISQQADTQEK